MKYFQQTITALLLCGTACVSAHAQTIKLKLAPGLWEETSTILINGQNVEVMMRKQMEQAMAHMTPEQRAQMQKSMPAMGGAGKQQTCLTPEQVAKGIDLASVKEKLQKAAQGCNLNLISTSENGGKFDMVCNQPDGSTGKSAGEYVVKNDKEWVYKFNGSGTVASSSSNGAARSMQVSGEVVARWKASNCGNVLPTE